jgi:hypothetical protein
LISEIREIRTRVSRLEEVLHVHPTGPGEATEAPPPATLTSSESPLIETVSAIPVLGRALQITHGDPAASRSVAAITLLTGIACYVVSFAFLEKRGTRNRNSYTYSTFGVRLTLVGTRILLASAYASLI